MSQRDEQKEFTTYFNKLAKSMAIKQIIKNVSVVDKINILWLLPIIIATTAIAAFIVIRLNMKYKKINDDYFKDEEAVERCSRNYKRPNIQSFNELEF